VDLAARFASHLAESGLLEGVRGIVAACSGGGDSTALLILLSEWAAPRRIALVAAHVAHGLRGRAGAEDGVFVARLAASLGVPFALRPVEVPRHRRKGESREAAARRLRYAALLALKEELGPGTVVVTGHTLDDQAETVLLHIGRKLGRSRGGIRARRLDGVVRPFLPFTRGELRSFLRERGASWREDETNEDEALARNRIRRGVLPALEQEAPGTARRLARAGEAWSERLAALDRRIDGALAAAGTSAGGPWPRQLLRRLGAEATSRLLVRAAGLAGAVPGRVQLGRATSRLLGDEPRWAETVGGLRLLADERVVRLLPLHVAPPDRLRTP